MKHESFVSKSITATNDDSMAKQLSDFGINKRFSDFQVQPLVSDKHAII